jgi:transcriptional regulator with XRE-family HTH domain
LVGRVKPGDLSAGEVFSARLAEVRKARGWTQTQLADRIVELGGVGLVGDPIHRVRLAKLEKDPAKARRVTLEEVLAISYALDVSPLYMVTPLEFDGSRLAVVGSGEQPASPDDARAWLRGKEPLPRQNPEVFARQMPTADFTDFITEHPEVAERIRRSAPYPKEEK